MKNQPIALKIPWLSSGNTVAVLDIAAGTNGVHAARSWHSRLAKKIYSIGIGGIFIPGLLALGGCGGGAGAASSKYVSTIASSTNASGNDSGTASGSTSSSPASGTSSGAALTAVVPTTTLAAETGNNTSAANSFGGFSNGDVPAGNVSKLPIASLLYPGATTAIYTAFQPWFGGNGHVNVGYNSDDPNQVHLQVQDMMSRGLSGAIVDWYYGPSFAGENQTTQLLMAEAEAQHGDFHFAIMADQGSIQSCGHTGGCDVTGALINVLNYAATTFEESPAYLRIDNQPVVFFFGEEQYPIDWNRVRANVTGNPLFIFQNSVGFFNAQSNGGYAWIEPSAATTSDPTAMAYLNDFYTQSLSVPAEQVFGGTYKGFNDSIASWNTGRLMPQDCGQTWLQTMAEAGKLYSSGKQLPQLQVITWNDYEEGTEMETGIDPCLKVTASVANNVATWTITGSENPIDHYTVFISSDGQNLMSLGDIPTGTYSMNLASFALSPGKYSIFVKATGKPNIQNRMSATASYTVAQ